ncbi:autotransporter domain-containing protein [Erythrobacter sp. NE805]|uniref:autotransporter outer membrane beta-barrel domain-containing protein n=1 Tax=Erythrobacter sp. NE805 TaxID=3389875 RepID=UPI00396B2650
MTIGRLALLATAGAPAMLASPLLAQTTVNDERTGPLRTSQAGNITLTEDGVVTVTSGPAIIVDSANSVTSEGEIETGEDSGAAGIAIRPNIAANITNEGDIYVRESFSPEDRNEDGVVDGPVARASGRYGILVEPGGTYTGNITDDGRIVVEGLNSGGIVVASTMRGDLVHTGSISVLGDNSVGVRTARVEGDVQLRGDITVLGRGASAYVAEGPIDGELVLQGTIAQRTNYTDDRGRSMSLSRNDLRAGAAAVWIKGDVTGGITVAEPPETESASDDDEDDDGFDDADEGTGSVVGYGAAPALLIGGSGPITIGAGDRGFALQIDGSVSGNGGSRGIDATGVSIGGSGEVVTLEGGVLLTGRINASTIDTTATGLLIGRNAVVPTLELRDGGTITTSISSTGDGASVGVRDLSGTLTTIRSQGFITANGSFEDEVVAIDLSANTTGVSIIQYSADDEDEDEEDLVNTSISGDIRTGSGNDLVDISDGQVRGDAFLGSGSDTVKLSGDAVWRGDISFGSSTGTLSVIDDAQLVGLLDFAGAPGTITIDGQGSVLAEISGGERLSVDVRSGSFGAREVETLSFSSLSVGSDGTLVVRIDTEEGTNSRYEVGTATFAAGSKIGLAVPSLDVESGSYTVLTADSLTGSPDFATEGGDLPFLYAGEVVTDTAAGEITLNIRRRDATELGLDPVLDAALPSLLTAAAEDAGLETSLLAANDGAVLRRQLLALTPEYTGGNFDLVTRASRTAAANLADRDTMFEASGTRIWLNAYTLSGERDAPALAGGYDISGTGITGGYEFSLGIGRVGLSGNAFWGENARSDVDGTTEASQYELALHWRRNFGKLLAFARGSAGYVQFGSERTFNGYSDGVEDDDEDGERDDPDVVRTATSDSSGVLLSGLAGVSWEGQIGRRLTITPEASVEYFRLTEDGYEEDGAGAGMNLTVADRKSDALNLNSLVTLSYSLGDRGRGRLPLAVSLSGGRRTNLGGALGDTTANFEDADPFTLGGRRLDDAWLGRATISGGGYDWKWFVTGSGEKETDQTTYSVQAGLELAF